MAAVQLEASDLTGIGVIDDQHQEIFDLVDALAELAETGNHEQIGGCINRIVSHSLAHFEFEEELMEQSDYPFIKVHKRLHDHFIQRLAGYTQRFDAGEDIAVELQQFLSKWLHSHFTHEDKDYSPQILVEMHGLGSEVSVAGNESWLSKTLHKIA
ncbi:MAG: bacteriohemerythrin [Pseudomonadota bacterium]